MLHALDLTHIPAKEIYPLGETFTGTAPNGQVLSLTNYYMTLDGQPYFGISGEMHYSRMSVDQWEEAVRRAKLGGLNFIATYVFWNIHEEVEGRFRFDGQRDIRRFCEICAREGMYVTLRMGPFNHGEMRNGGLPDWLYGKPYEVRSTDPGFLDAVRRFYSAVSEQVRGLMYADGGPIAAVQLDNEYEHSAAPWEMTTGIANEWTASGAGGRDYMLALLDIARETGLTPPLYTCTSWGGAITPDDVMLPLWGGYSYQPWIYSSYEGPHPASNCYIYRNIHDRSFRHARGSEFSYDPDTRPFACCEMMGGMACFYRYRFNLPYECVDAHTNTKLANGCNMPGYYMYRGGTNLRGETVPYTNEWQLPKMSYDYQAAIGEFGQLRPSYHRLRLLHIFCRSFQDVLCPTRTVLSSEQSDIAPTDTDTLRWAVRVQGDSGFVFLNNFQDHAPLSDKKDEDILLQLPGGDVTFRGLSLRAGENAVLPFGMDLGAARLVWASAQPITFLPDEADGTVWFFFAPAGMAPAYHLRGVSSVEGCTALLEDGMTVIRPDAVSSTVFSFTDAAGKRHTVVTLTREDSLSFYRMEIGGRQAAILCDAPVLPGEDGLQLEVNRPETRLCAWPAGILSDLVADVPGVASIEPCTVAALVGWRIRFADDPYAGMALVPRQAGPSRYLLDIPRDAFAGCRQLRMQVDCSGDIGHAFVDGELIHDHFCGGGDWVIRLDPWAEKLAEHPLTVYITPIREGSRVRTDSPMAAQKEEYDTMLAALHAAVLQPVRDVFLPITR